MTDTDYKMEMYDEVVVQLSKDGVPKGTIKMSTANITDLMNMHGQEMGDILELMVQTIVSGIKE